MENQNTFHKGDYIIIQEELDSYGIDSIYDCINTQNNQKYICKLINKKNFKNNQTLQNELSETIKILLEIKHDNITNLCELIQGKSNYYLFYDYIEGKTLKKIKKDGKKFQENEIFNIIDKVMDGIIYLYQNRIILKDINLDNIFITTDGQILLCNLSKNKSVIQADKDFKLKNGYMKISLKIGITICKLLDFNYSNYLKENNLKGDENEHLSLMRNYINNNIINKRPISKQLKQLINELLEDVPNRINIETIKSHKWFKSFNKKEINPNKIQLKKSKEYMKSSINDELNKSNISNLRESQRTISKNKEEKNMKEEDIITDEAYFEYYQKEREVLLGLIDSFDKNEILNNVKLAEKYYIDKAINDKKNKPEKKFTINNDEVFNSINDEMDTDYNKKQPKKGERGKGLGIFACHT